MRATLKAIVEESTTVGGKVFDLAIQTMIAFSLVSFAVETLPGLSITAQRVLYWCELATVVAFTVEYVVRLWVADSKIRFVFSFFGLIDLAAILPFYVAAGMDLRVLRIFRMMRLFRVFKLVRYTRALERFARAFWLIRHELCVYLIVSGFVLYVAAAGIYYFEGETQPESFGSIFHCLWWAIVTLTTVGYGDCYPVTVGGRIFTSVLVVLGIGVVAVPSGLLASALTVVRQGSEETESD
ncbi:ion transporter [Thermostilla marina]